MWNRHPSLFTKISGLILAQMAVVGALVFVMTHSPEVLPRVMILAGLALITAGTVLVLQRLFSPLKVLSDAAAALAEGRSAATAKLAVRRDEIGIISRELERLCRQHFDRIIKDDEAQERQRVEVETIDRDLHVTKAEAAYLKVVVDALDGGMRRLAVGDLTVRLDMPFPTEHEGLRADFNYAVGVLQRTLSEVGIGSRKVAASGAELEIGLADAAQRQARASATMSSLISDFGSLIDGVKRQKMQSAHLATIAHNASLDMRRPKQAIGEAITALDAVGVASGELQPAAQDIIDAAFQANILAMNLGIEASSLGKPRLTAIAEEIRGLAAQLSEAAKAVGAQARNATDAAERGSKAADQARREWDAMSVYITALRDQIEALDRTTAKESEAAAAFLTKITMLAKEGKDQGHHIDALAQTLAGFSRSALEMDQEAAKFAPVTVLKPGGVTVPESVKRSKTRTHLRLVKS